MGRGLGTHLLVLAALVVNLWVGGDLFEAWAGRGARHLFELALILGYLWLVLGIGPALRGRGTPERAAQGDDERAP
ncbi:MAG: hypothetical protein FJZ92_00310 [Chloroflexi bacterium]|nr:hypothetical protein [Chloroflexota bacterium]